MQCTRTVKLLEIYGACPKCGNETIRPNKDTLKITENEFERTCDCGFSVNVVER